MTDQRKRILVVEDNVALANVVRFNLSRSGYEVEIARTGAEAWERIQQQPPDLVIIDHQMPVMTGSQLCERIRADERTAGVPLVMLTAKKFEIDIARLRDELNVRKIIPKPFSPRDLMRTVDSCLAEDTVAP